MIICDMCKKNITDDTRRISLWLDSDYEEKLIELNFSHNPEFCSVKCVIKYLQDFKDAFTNEL